MGIERISDAFFEALRPPAKLSLSAWSDRFAFLSAESSADVGRWKTLPYQREMMDAISDPTIEQITVIKSARVGYTKMLNNAIGYFIHQDPCSIMLVQPTEGDAEGYSKEEIAPMIRDTPVLQGIVSEAKSKDGSNTILQKMFPGGTLSLVGANAPRGFRRVSRRVVLFDEVDGYPVSAGTEGDPIKLGMRRSEYFWNRKIVAGSTPLTKDISRIERLFEQSDQRRYFVPCPTCGHMDHLVFRKPKTKEEVAKGGHWMTWLEGEPETAHFTCSSNQCVIPHARKKWMIERGQWRGTAPFNGKHAGFHIWAAYSYSPNASWAQLAIEFLEAKSDPESLKTFINTALGETWEDAASAKIGADSLESRVETYQPNMVPEKAFVLVAGIDVQDDRVAISKYAFGREEEQWLVSHQEIYGDPSRPEIWKQIDDVVLRAYPREGGGEMPVHSVAIDTGGHFTHESYAWARSKKPLASKTFVLAVKGSSQKGQVAIGKPSKKDVDFKGRSLKRGVELYMVGTDTIKNTLMARLRGEIPGPGYIHFHGDVPTDFFAQITSEKKITEYHRGVASQKWVKLKASSRNEALDTMVYAYAALQFLYTRYNRKTIWDQLEKRALGKRAENSPNSETQPEENLITVKNSEQSSSPKPKPQTNIEPRGRRKGFIGNW